MSNCPLNIKRHCLTFTPPEYAPSGQFWLIYALIGGVRVNGLTCEQNAPIAYAKAHMMSSVTSLIVLAQHPRVPIFSRIWRWCLSLLVIMSYPSTFTSHCIYVTSCQSRNG